MTNKVFIHESAQVSDQTKLGDGTKIWNLVQIRENSSIGENCIISKNVYVDFGISIGSNVKIQNNVSVYNGVTIEDDVFVGPCVVFTNDYLPRATSSDWQVTPTLIKKGASLGANCTIVCGNEVGEHALVAAGSVVTKSVPPHALVAGNPAKPIAFVFKGGQKVETEHMAKVGTDSVTFIHPETHEELVLAKSELKLLPTV
jgi:acetyltransferase-like isoleucine patch superfamily enzyme